VREGERNKEGAINSYRRSQSEGCHFRFHRCVVGLVVGMVVVMALSWCLRWRRKRQHVEGEGSVG
jgi:hypothetical protein